MNKVLLSLVSTVFLFACSGTAEKAEDGSTVAKVNKNMICENTATTGSHLRKKKCMTKAQAEHLRKISKEDMQRAQKHIDDTVRR